MEPLTADDPHRIGRYELLGRIGSGGMGRVYLGRSAAERLVAIKVIHREFVESPEFRARFAREIAAARAVGGFYTAVVVDADPDAEQPWLATEYVAGPALDQAVRENGPITGDRLRLLALGLAEALSAIHAAGLVHRDFKPSNVLLAPDGPRVIDFGIARAFDGTALTAAQQFVGTPGFMAPEQLRDGTVSAAADVFCLGMTLAFAATGRAPFGTGEILELSYRVVNNEPDLIGVPPALLGIVERCLAKEPGQRPAVQEVLEALSSAAPASGDGIAPLPVGTGARRPALPIAVSSLAILAIAAAVGFWYLNDDKGSVSGDGALAGSTSTSAPQTPMSQKSDSQVPGSPGSSPATPATPSTSADPNVVVGSGAFPESALVAEIYAQALTAKNIPVTRKFNIGSRDVLYASLKNGTVSVIPEYNSALLAFLDNTATATTTEAVDSALAAKLSPDLQLLDPAPAQDNDSLMVTASTAAKYHLKSISDLASVAGTLTLGAPADFNTRRQGLPGLHAAYGLTFKTFKPLDSGGPLTLAALRDNQIQVADLFTTDPAIVTDHLIALTDDKNVLGVDNVVPLAARSALPPTAADALNAVSAKLTTSELTTMMEKVVVAKVDPAKVAHRWLVSSGLA